LAKETVVVEESSVSGLALALGGYTVLFALKLITYFVTSIGVMYAESLHSLADMLISGFLLVAALWSRKPADQSYRYGYGRAQNVAALVAATIFISFTALEAFREAMNKLFGGEASEYSNLTLAIVVTVIAIVISAFPLVKIWWSKEKGAAARAQFIESINDEVALFAALIGILLIANGIAIADGIASLIVAIVIATNAGILWWENAKNLMGHSPEKDFYHRVEEMAISVNGVVGVHDLRAEMIGGQVHLEMHIEVPRGTSIEEADRIAEHVDEELGNEIEHAYCTIHVDPAQPGQVEPGEREMPTKMPTDILEEEHRYIRQVVGAMSLLVEGLESGQKVERQTLQGIVEFMRTFADKCHHGKEETHLFAILEEKGVPLGGCPVGALVYEHQQGRTLVNQLATAVESCVEDDVAARASLANTLRSLMNLYPNHIWKEDFLLFPMTNKVLNQDEQKDLLEKFRRIETEIGQETHQQFGQLASQLLESLTTSQSGATG